MHGLVNVAALTTRRTLFDDTPEHFDGMMVHNVRAPYFLIQAAARLMIDTGVAGSIVNVGSTSGTAVRPSSAPIRSPRGRWRP